MRRPAARMGNLASRSTSSSHNRRRRRRRRRLTLWETLAVGRGPSSPERRRQMWTKTAESWFRRTDYTFFMPRNVFHVRHVGTEDRKTGGF